MNAKTIFILLVIVALPRAGWSAEVTLSSTTAPVLYVVRAGGSVSHVGLTNAPESNLAHVSLVDWEQFDPPIAVLRITAIGVATNFSIPSGPP